MHPNLFCKPSKSWAVRFPSLNIGHFLIILGFLSAHNVRHDSRTSSQEPFARDGVGLLWGLPMVTGISSSEWNPLREAIGGWYLMGHKVNAGSRQEHPPNSLYPKFLRIPPSQILWDLSYPSRGPEDLSNRKGEPKTREQKGICDFI